MDESLRMLGLWPLEVDGLHRRRGEHNALLGAHSLGHVEAALRLGLALFKVATDHEEGWHGDGGLWLGDHRDCPSEACLAVDQRAHTLTRRRGT